MKKALIAIGGVVVGIIVLAIIAPMLVPLDTYKEQLTAQVRAATGRDLVIDGDIRLSLLPSVEIVVENLHFANAPGAGADDMVSLSRLEAKLEVFPLISGSIEIARFVLVDPVINLEVDSGGRPNWAFDVAGGAAPSAAPAQSEGGGEMALADLRLGDVRIENGTLAYRDATGADYRLSEINMKLALASLDSPLEADGSLVFNGQRLSLKAGVVTPARLAAGERAEINARIESSPLVLSFAGGLAAGSAFSADGRIDLDVPSLRELAAWTGNPIEVAGSGFGPFRVKGVLSAGRGRYAFSEAEISFDEINGRGAFAVDLAGARPRVTGRLDVDALDLNPYLPPESAASGGEGATAESTSGAPGTWSDEPIDFSALKALDADLAFSTGALAARKVKIGRSVLKVNLDGGRLVVDLAEMALYDGNGAARIELDTRKEVPRIVKSVRISGVQAQPLLRDSAGFERLSGTAAAEFTVTGFGRSEREIVSNLNGKGSVTFLDGAIEGIDIGAMVRNVKSAFLGAGAGEAQKTDFAELSGSFVIENGILRNDDLKLLAPLLRIQGSGTVDLPARRLKYRIEPKLAATAEGQGGATDVAGIMVPVIAEGPWHDIAYRPDLAGIVEGVAKSPKALIETGKGLVGQGAGGVKGLVEGVTGGGQGGEQGTTAPNPLKMLKGLFGN